MTKTNALKAALTTKDNVMLVDIQRTALLLHIDTDGNVKLTLNGMTKREAADALLKHLVNPAFAVE